jgi:hypothetical protein
MARYFILITLIFAFFSSFAGETLDNCSSHQVNKAQVKDQCCAHENSNSFSTHSPGDQEPVGDCCGSYCACTTLLNFHKNRYITLNSNQEKYFKWDIYKQFYQSPCLDPALKPPLLS